MWIRQDNEISFTARDVEATKDIPVGYWLVKFDIQRGFYLEKSVPFKMPVKIYGDSEKIAARYLNTFSKITSNMGALLTGLKGTGKSVTAKLLCKNSNIPIILISEPFIGDSFKSLLSNITQEVVIFIDEFEKIYNKVELQDSFLSMLDGVFEGKKLFIFTSNEKGKINQYMINRPGRVRYLREYDTLEASIVEDVIEDTLIKKENKEGLLEVLGILGSVTMDILVSLISEMNMYNETARESARFLNLKPEGSLYSMEIFQENISIGKTRIYNHPLAVEFIEVNVHIPDLSYYKGGSITHASLVSIYLTGKKNQEKTQNFDPIGAIGTFKVDVKQSKVTQEDSTIYIEDKNATQYVFTKLSPYNFTF